MNLGWIVDALQLLGMAVVLLPWLGGLIAVLSLIVKFVAEKAERMRYTDISQDRALVNKSYIRTKKNIRDTNDHSDDLLIGGACAYSHDSSTGDTDNWDFELSIDW